MVKLIPYILSIILAVNISSTAMAQDYVSYDDTDISVLKSILNETQNNEDLLCWDITNPSNINEVEWKKVDDEYYLYSLDLSNLPINGDINLTDCLYLEECDFSNTNINSIQLPCSLKNISNKSFENCSSLQVITINADDTVIGSNVFSGCISLKSIVNTEKITSIGRNAFNNCENLNFYFSESNSNPYIENYVQQHDFNIFNSVITNAYGYAGRMYNYKITKFNLNESPLPYTSGKISLYTLDKQFIKTIDIDENGKFSIEDLTIGTKYRVVIDGKTAIPREEYFIPVTQDYCITSDTECFGVIVCDYNRDGIVNYGDGQGMLEGLRHDLNDENFDFSVHDFNHDGFCNSTDVVLFSNFAYVDYHDFNYN